MNAPPWVSMLVLAPLLVALATMRMRDEAARRQLAIVTSAIVLAGSVALAYATWSSTAPIAFEDVSQPFFGARWHLGLDALSAPFLPLAALVSFLVFVASPKSSLEGRMLPALLLTEAATLGVVSSIDAACLALFWVTSLVPAAFVMNAPKDHPARRAYLIFLVTGAIPLVLAVGLVANDRMLTGLADPFDLSLASPRVSLFRQPLIFVLVAAALGVRKAVFPLHSWLPALASEGPGPITILLTGTHLGAFLAGRMLLPLVPETAAQFLPIFADVALFSALYGAVLATGQRNLRRMLGFVVMSQMSLILVGIGEANPASLHGAFLQMIALGLTSTGLFLTLLQLEARTGTTDIQALGGGLAHRMPRLAGGFFALCLAAVGFPGTLMFISEDLLLHGLLDAHPVEGSILLVVTVLNGITLLTAHFRTFFGKPRRISTAPDLHPRETLGLAVVLLAVLVLGLFPTPLLTLRAPLVTSLATSHPTAEHHHP